MERTSDTRALRDEGRPGAFERLRGSRLRPWVSLLAAVAVVALICLVQTPKYAVGDDFMQDLYVRGAYLDTPSSLMLYSLVTFSAPVSLLYTLVPSVPWYPLVLLAMVAVSFAVMLDMALSAELGAPTRALVLVGLALCEVMTVTYFTYTAVAFVAFSAGLAVIIRHAAFERPERLGASDVGAYLLLLEGFSLRPESGVSALMIFAPFCIWAIARTRNLRTMLMAAGVVGVMAACYVAGMVAWHTTEGWEEYEQTFHAAQAVVDYEELDIEDVTAAGLDLSENDLAMVYEFAFVDSDVYSLELFEALGELVESYTLQTMVETMLSRKSLTAFVLFLDVITYALAGLVVAVRGYRRASERVLVFSIPTVLLLQYLLLFMRARPRIRVIVPMFAVTVFALVVCCFLLGERAGGASGPARGAHFRPGATDGVAAAPARTLSGAVERALAIAGIVAFVGVTALIEVKYVSDVQDSLTSELTANTKAYVEEHSDTYLLFTLTQNALACDDIWAFDSWELPQNAIFVGGYECFTPAWETLLEEMGLESRDGFLLNLLEDGFASVSYEYQAEMLVTYLEEHTGHEVEATAVAELGTFEASTDVIYVWTYSIVG